VHSGRLKSAAASRTVLDVCDSCKVSPTIPLTCSGFNSSPPTAAGCTRLAVVGPGDTPAGFGAGVASPPDRVSLGTSSTAPTMTTTAASAAAMSHVRLGPLGFGVPSPRPARGCAGPTIVGWSVCTVASVAWESAVANARQVGYLLAGSLAIARWITGSRCARSGLTSEIRGGGDDRWLLMTIPTFELSYGGFPVSSWNAVAASAYWSVRP